jgi:anti-sigma28 factor (negative regulator of flagellin synthesis)
MIGRGEGKGVLSRLYRKRSWERLMSGINGIGNNPQVQRILSNPVRKSLPTEQAAGPTGADKLELSGMSHLMKALQQNDIRADKVAAIRSAIENGTYEDDRKLDIAVDRLLDDLLK